ncbi:tail fiber protein [Morganella morganii]
MFYIDNDSGVTVMPPVSAQRSAIVRWFSEGDGNNVITWPGMDWFNIVQAELLNTLEEAGIQPDKTKLNQLALSIKSIMSNNALLIKNNLSEIKIAGASAQRTARENLDIYDASLNKKGLVQLTSATDSPSETLAATAKAVKIAMDNANARLAKDRNGADIPNKPLFIQNLGLQETVNQASGALQKNQNGADIPDKKLFLRNIGTTNSTTMSFSGGTGWFRLATVTMPQASSVVYISLIGGAGYNVNSPMQAGISELVLRAGNGNPKGLTGALWRRTSVGFTNFAWVNTSGDTYDVYVEIGNYATGVNIQWDYTSNASVTIHTSPSYTANKPTGLTDGTVYVIYSSHIKPTAADVGALSLSGGQLNGALGIGTSSALGGNSIVLGDNDTGFKQNGDGILDVYTNSQRVFRFQNGVAIAFKNIQAGDGKKFTLSSSNNSTKNATFNLWGASTRPVVAELGDEAGWHFYSQRNTDNSVIFSVNGQIQPSNWGNFDSRYVKDVRLGTRVVQLMARGGRYEKAGHAITGLRIIGEVDGDDEAIFRPIQKYINGTWYNVAQV